MTLLSVLLGCIGGHPCPAVIPPPDPVPEASPCTPSAGDPVVVCPEPAEGWMPIPDVGISTFGRTASEQEPRYPRSTVVYGRWWWRELETGPGRYDLSPIRDLLDRATAEGEDLGIRVMPEGSGQPDVPQHLIDRGLPGTRYGGGFSPDYDDPRFLDAAEALIRAIGAAFDGDPHLAWVDVGMIGEAGEWHVSRTEDQGGRLPSAASAHRIIDAHLDAFPHTPVVMLLGSVDDGGEPVRYATERGAGWRADCFGDLGAGWNHMDDFYLQRIEEADLGEVWRTAPVLWETCGAFPTWKLAGVDADCTFDYALGLHSTGLNAKSRRLPPKYDPAVDELLDRMGYRLSLVSLSHPASVAAGETLPVATRWLNAGVAPPYRPFRLAYRFAGDGGRIAAPGTTIAGWLPGETEVTDTVIAPATPGIWTLEVAILGVGHDNAPRVPLGTVGGRTGAWTALSEVVVGE